MHIHANATTNLKQRQTIRFSEGSCGTLARQFHVSRSTVQKWKHREDPADKSCRPDTVEYSLSSEEEAFVLAIRGYGFSLDDVVDAVEPVLPQVVRASVHRLFV